MKTVGLSQIIPVFLCLFACVSGSFDVDILRGRKDPDSCCDKLENATFSTNCQQSMLTAAEDVKFAYTPGFPNQFPIQKLCSWGIYARPGKRVRLEFRDFYLIGPGEDGTCDSQGVIIKSPLTGLQMGPHCGNAGMPSIVSAGNYLVVELVSNIPMTSENFRGFKMSYKETMETPSGELRPANWRSDVILTADPLLIKSLFPSATIASPKRPPKTTLRPSRFQPPRRPGSFPSRPVDRAPGRPESSYPGQRYPDRYVKPPMKRPSPSAPPKKRRDNLSLETIVAISVGCIIAVAIIIVVVIKWRQTCVSKNKKKKRANGEEETKTEIGNGNPALHLNQLPGQDGLGQANPGYANSIPNVPGYYFYYYDEGSEDNKKDHKDGTIGGPGSHRSELGQDAAKRKGPSRNTAVKTICKSRRKNGGNEKSSRRVKGLDPGRDKQKKMRRKRDMSSSSAHQKNDPTPDSGRGTGLSRKRHSKQAQSEKKENEAPTLNSLKMRPPGRQPRKKTSKPNIQEGTKLNNKEKRRLKSSPRTVAKRK